MVRKLPGVYTSLYDMSTLPEGEANLTVGYVLRANRGKVGEAVLCTSPTDFLNKFTFSGAPAPSDDWTYHSILKVLNQTNTVYVSRAQNGALFGGLVVKREHDLGRITSIDRTTNIITVEGELTQPLTKGQQIRLTKPSAMAGHYLVYETTVHPASTGVPAYTTVTVAKEIDSEGNVVRDEEGNLPRVFPADYSATGADDFQLISSPVPVQLNEIDLCDFTQVLNANKDIDGVDLESVTRHVFLTAEGDFTKFFLEGDRVDVKGTSNAFTVLASTPVTIEEKTYTRVLVEEQISDDITTGTLKRNSISDPESFAFTDEDLFLVTGIDQGAYNGRMGIEIVSSTDTPDELTEDNVFTIATYNMNTGLQLDMPMMVSREEDAKAFDGSGIYITEVVKDTSGYIQVVNNTDVDGTLQPGNTNGIVRLGGGFDGKAVEEANMIGALDVFKDKVIPISILGNGSQESALFQQAMLELATTRLDCIAFLNDRASDEKAKFNSTKATNIVNYKKNTLASTSYLGTMYVPHLTVADPFNARTLKIGADGVAIAGWLNVLRTMGMPNAYAGPANGLVTGCTCDWKIGDTSGEAEILNDASINFIAFDAKVGRYYMQCQNTLQVANSSLRNLGAVFNVLDIKETLARYLKEYLQKPITNRLREEILTACRAHMNLMLSQDRVTGFAFVDTTSDYDLSNNTLRYVCALALTPYAQQIYLVMNIVNQMFDFSILQSA